MTQIHNFIISNNENPDNRIQNELEGLRSKHNGFSVQNITVSQSPIGLSTVTVLFNGK